MGKRPHGGRGALARPSPPRSFAHSIHPVWPTGIQYNARVTFTYFCIFVLLPFANSIIFAKRGESTNEYERSTKNLRETTSRAVQTSTNGAQTSPSGVQTREGNAITDSTNEYKWSTNEHKRKTNEYKWNTKT